MNICDSISFRISSSYESITAAVSGILNFLGSTGGNLNDDLLFDIKVILNELIINAVKHGNHFDCSKNVDVTAEVTDDRYVHLMIKDEGIGYDQDTVARKCGKSCGESDIYLLDECGRGMLIVQKLSDKVIVSESGSRIEVFKKL